MTLSDEAAGLLREAAAWRLLGVLFERPHGPWHAEVEVLSDTCGGAAREDAARLAEGATEGAYLEWLGPGGLVSPRESAYRSATDPGHLLAELEAYYGAFGYTPRTEEPPDHVSVEAGFLGYLHLKEAHALAQGQAEAAQVTAEAAARFLRDHLAVMGEPLRDALAAAPAPLAFAASILRGRTGPRPPQVEGGWAPRGLDAACLSCEELNDRTE